MGNIKGDVESIELGAEDKGLVFVALGRMEAEAAKVYKSADKLGIKKAAANVAEFRSKIDALKQRFL